MNEPRHAVVSLPGAQRRDAYALAEYEMRITDKGLGVLARSSGHRRAYYSAASGYVVHYTDDLKNVGMAGEI